MIAIGSDQGGYALKQTILQYLDEQKIPYTDLGSFSEESCDYPIYAKKVVAEILEKKAEQGILICGTGLGMSMTANRYPGIRAAVCTDTFMAKATREHNDANILCLGGRVIGPGVALEIVDTFLHTPFSNAERHMRRVKDIEH